MASIPGIVSCEPGVDALAAEDAMPRMPVSERVGKKSAKKVAVARIPAVVSSSKTRVDALAVEKAVSSITVPDHLRARQLLLQALDDPDCLLTPQEFMLLRRCSRPQVYALMKKGVLQGPPGRPCRGHLPLAVSFWFRRGAVPGRRHQPPQSSGGAPDR